MAGEEFGRVYSWGHDPMRKGDHTIASPCSHFDLPQTELEPILTRRAVQRGWMIRFNTTFVSIKKSTADKIDCEINDDMTNRRYTIRCRYLFECDGAQSQVVRELQLPFDTKEGQDVALNILVRADLSHLIRYRNGNLHWVFEPDKERPPWG
jgi:2-polyprenyl-6-methoxyphenol hydroxylase-like FAD-dependent oxidoreductase